MALREWPRICYTDGDKVEIIVPTCRNGIVEYCHVEFKRDPYRRAWEFRIADELIRQAPEAVHAVIGLALMELKKVTPSG